MRASVLGGVVQLLPHLWPVGLFLLVVAFLVAMAGVVRLADMVTARPRHRAHWRAYTEPGYRRPGAGAHRG